METTERRRVIGLGDAPRTRRATLDGSQSTLDGSQYGRLAGRVCATVHAHPVSWSERTAWIAALETLPRFADNPHALSGNPRKARCLLPQHPETVATRTRAGWPTGTFRTFATACKRDGSSGQQLVLRWQAARSRTIYDN